LETVGRGAGIRPGRLARALGAACALAALAACDPWNCDFESHGACIEFTTDPPDMDAARLRVDALLARELPFWGINSLSGWRIQYRDTTEYSCYLAASSEGCTDYLEKTMSVRVPPTARGCFEAAELLHELGHYELGDPMHSNDLWKDLDGAFARMVWDFPGAPPECVSRYKGVTTGMWAVTPDHF
jgi:hypothetical protein